MGGELGTAGAVKAHGDLLPACSNHARDGLCWGPHLPEDQVCLVEEWPDKSRTPGPSSRWQQDSAGLPVPTPAGQPSRGPPLVSSKRGEGVSWAAGFQKWSVAQASWVSPAFPHFPQVLLTPAAAPVLKTRVSHPPVTAWFPIRWTPLKMLALRARPFFSLIPLAVTPSDIT